eukprot:gene12395-14166_t
MGRSFIGPDRELHRSEPQLGAAGQRPRKQIGKVSGLVETVDRGEDELDGPLGGEALGLQRIGETQAANGQVRPRGAAAVELQVDVLPLRHRHARRQTVDLRADEV